jgi:hypothetical protein
MDGSQSWLELDLMSSECKFQFSNKSHTQTANERARWCQTGRREPVAGEQAGCESPMQHRPTWLSVQLKVKRRLHTRVIGQSNTKEKSKEGKRKSEARSLSVQRLCAVHDYSIPSKPRGEASRSAAVIISSCSGEKITSGASPSAGGTEKVDSTAGGSSYGLNLVTCEGRVMSEAAFFLKCRLSPSSSSGIVGCCGVPNLLSGMSD